MATYSIPSGNATTSNCGYYTFSSYLLLQGGLQGSYFTNRWFAGNPYTTKVDSTVNFNWGTGMIIPEVASNYVSIVW
jgi:PA14 domain